MSAACDVPAGYKQTEVGVIPNDWGVAPLRKVCTIERGKFSVRPRNDPRYYGGTTPFLQTGDITNSNGHVTTYGQTLNARGVKVSRVFPAGTLLFTIAANIADVAFASFDAACPDSIVGITPAGDADSTWLAYELRSHKAAFEELATKNAQLNINLEKLHPYRIPYPPLNEQRAIADALGDVDALLDALDRLITKQRDLKQAAMQQLLTGRTRLPGFTGEWQVVRLGDHLTFLKHGTNSRAELTAKGSVQYLHYGDIHGAAGVMLDPGTTRMPYLPEPKARALDRLQDGDLVFADASEDLDGVGRSVELCGVGTHEVVSGMHTIAVRFDPAVLANGFKAYLQFLPAFCDHLRRLAAGTKVYATNRAYIANAEVALPRAAEQTAIAAVLSDMDAEITALEARRAKTRDLKQAMLQELLTGRTRLV